MLTVVQVSPFWGEGKFAFEVLAEGGEVPRLTPHGKVGCFLRHFLFELIAF